MDSFSGQKEGFMEHGLSRSQIIYLVDEWILNARDRNIVKRRLIDGITYEEVAEEFHLSAQRVKEIVGKSLEVILRHQKIN